jgi:hypothetical protein
VFLQLRIVAFHKSSHSSSPPVLHEEINVE